MIEFLFSPSWIGLFLLPFIVVYGIMDERREQKRLEREMREAGLDEETIAVALKFFRDF